MQKSEIVTEIVNTMIAKVHEKVKKNFSILRSLYLHINGTTYFAHLNAISILLVCKY